MPVWIALLRGINVGGRAKVPMKELVGDLESLGFQDVRTHIQSGNVVFRSSERSPKVLAGKIEDALERRHGIRPRVLPIRPSELARAIESNPFPDAEAEPKTLHLFFLESTPGSPDLPALAAAAAANERFRVVGRVFYLHAPGGIGRSRLAAKAERCLGVPATARNLRTVLALRELADAVG